MSRDMDTLFVRAGRPLRLHFDDTRITAVAIRQLSWRVEQGGGAIVEHPSGADVLVVDPAAPWVFQEFLRSKLPELRPSVVLAFWIPLCLTTRSLIWINHPYWQQVAIPSERTSHSEIPRGVTAYSSFLAGIAYSRIAPFSSSKTVSRRSRALDRDSSVISNLDNSDLEVSRSLEPGASSDDEPLETARKPKRPSPRKTKPRSDSTSAATPPLRPTEVQRDEAEVSEILPETPLSAEDVDMLPPSPLPEPVRQPRRVAVVENVAPAHHSRSAEEQPYSAPNLSGTQHHSSPRHSSPQHEPDLSLPLGDPSPESATDAVEPNTSPKSNTMQPVVQARPSTAPQYMVTNSAPPVASETVSATEEPYIPPTLDSTPPPASDEPNGTPPGPSPPLPNILTNGLSIGNAAVLDKSTAASEPPNKFEELKRAQKQTFSASGTIEAAGSAATTETSPFTESSQPRASASTAPPSTPASVPKTSAPPKKSSVSGLKYISDSSSGTQSSKPSPANVSKIKVRPKMRPGPQPDGNDPVASSSSPRTSLSHPKSKLNIQSGANGTSAKPRPSVVASTTGVTSLIKPSQSSTATTAAPVGSPASTISSSVTNATGSLPASATTTPATTVAADTPKPAPGSSLSRPKQLIIRSPTISTTTLSRPNASVSPVQSRHPAPTSGSQPRALSPEAVPPFNSPPPPPTPTPEQLTALAAKRPAWTKEEDQYIIDYMNWVFAQDPLASTSEIMKEIAANCPYRSVGNWQNRFRSKEDSIYMNEVPVLFERLTNKTSGVGSSRSNTKTLEILSGTRTRSRGAVDYVDSSADEDEDSSDDGSGPPRKRTRRSQAGGRRHSNRLG